MRKRFLPLIVTFGVAIGAASFNFGANRASATVPGTNTLVSVNRFGTSSVTGGTDSNGGEMSADGRFMIFSSSDYNVVPSDTNNQTDVFLRDLANSTTSRVSVSSSGAEANGSSGVGRISETGRYVLFHSHASNLIAGVTVPTTYYQLYLRDTVANTTVLLSQNSSGTAANSDTIESDISADGRFILFESGATNLGPSVTNTTTNLYMLDRTDGTFSLLNYKYDGSLPNQAYMPSARMSCDGSLIVFQAGGLTSGSGAHLDVYLLDRRAGTQLTDLTVTANGSAGDPTISCDGNYVGFASNAYNIDPAYTTSSGQYHAYTYDRVASSYSLIDKTSAGVVASTSASCPVYGGVCVSISNSGIAAFASTASGLTSIGATGTQIYVKNVRSGAIDLLSQNGSGAWANNINIHPLISYEGKTVSYGSKSTNLVSVSDTNNSTDAFTSLTGY